MSETLDPLLCAQGVFPTTKKMRSKANPHSLVSRGRYLEDSDADLQRNPTTGC
jgi:hypothetical protein